MGALPTKRVIVLATGNEVTINASDFDASLYEDVGAPSVPASVQEPEPGPADEFDETPGAISTVNAEDARQLVAEAETVADLDALEDAEKASQKNPGGRKGILKAIKERREELG